MIRRENAAGPAASERAGESPDVHDTVSLVETWIARPPEQVWPVMRELHRWKRAGGAPRHVAGPLGEVGEVLSVGPASDGAAGSGAALHLRTVRLEPPTRWVLRLSYSDGRGGSAAGYIEFHLAAELGGTRFAYRVFVASRDANPPTPDFRSVLDAAAIDRDRRLLKEGAMLKNLVEADGDAG